MLKYNQWERSEIMRNLSEQELVRREKMQKIRDLGIDPFGSRFDRTAYAKDIVLKYQVL